MLYHQTFDCRFYVGNTVDLLNELEPKSVHLIMTSPPYWGLRMYDGVEPSIWGGRADCQHVWVTSITPATNGLVNNPMQGNTTNENSATRRPRQSADCTLCGAWLGMLGLEPLHDCLGWARRETCGRCFICHMRTIAAGLWRVLRDDGVFFCNIGDSYAGSGKGPTGFNGIGDQEKRQGFTSGNHETHENYHGQRTKNIGGKRSPAGLKPKDRVGIPERLALALQSDGWYWRDTIHMVKTAAMPESVTDRTTQAHEPLFVFTKQAHYFWDQEGVKEDSLAESVDRYKYAFCGPKSEPNDSTDNRTHPKGMKEATSRRNPRNWQIWKPESNNANHYASFPSQMPSFAIRAATSERGACAKCGAQWIRTTKPTKDYAKYLGKDWSDDSKDATEGRGHSVSSQRPTKRNGTAMTASYETTGWRPGCKCNAEIVPAVVLDPFAGTGTTNRVARQLGRDSIYFDASPKYAKDAVRALERITPMMPELLEQLAPRLEQATFEI